MWKNQNLTSVLTFTFSHRVPPCPLKDRLGTPSKVLGSASLSPSSCLLPSSASASASLPCSAILPKLLQLPGHHHSRHHWCMPFSFAVHWDLCFTCVYVHRLTAQSWKWLAVSLNKFESECVDVSFRKEKVQYGRASKKAIPYIPSIYPLLLWGANNMFVFTFPYLAFGGH